uniref:Uncharacterized protein n=1 Tax=viral metagenome TaxID=1070528 RepID=A0A6M3M5E7_9ZZZZ
MDAKICVVCGLPADGEHHLIAQTLLKTLPRLTPDDIRVIKETKISLCQHHHNLLEEISRIYTHLIRCALEERPYHLSTSLPHRKAKIEIFSEKNRAIAVIVEKLDSIHDILLRLMT